MPVSGLVITFDNAVASHSQSVERLQQHPQVEVGVAQGQRLPVVLDTPSELAEKQLREWVHELPGVVLVDIVFVGFEDPSADVGVGGVEDCEPDGKAADG